MRNVRERIEQLYGDEADNVRDAEAAPAEITHPCEICGGPAIFGFGVFLRRGQPGRWACGPHRDQVEGAKR